MPHSDTGIPRRTLVVLMTAVSMAAVIAGCIGYIIGEGVGRLDCTQ